MALYAHRHQGRYSTTQYSTVRSSSPRKVQYNTIWHCTPIVTKEGTVQHNIALYAHRHQGRYSTTQYGTVRPSSPRKVQYNTIWHCTPIVTKEGTVQHNRASSPGRVLHIGTSLTCLLRSVGLIHDSWIEPPLRSMDGPGYPGHPYHRSTYSGLQR